MYLFTVEDTFWITGRGLVLTPGFGNKPIRVGTGIRLIRPDQSVLLTTIRGVTFQGEHPILIAEELKKEDVPIGTEVWLAEDHVAKPKTTTKELLRILKTLKQHDRGRSVFGAATHRYRLAVLAVKRLVRVL